MMGGILYAAGEIAIFMLAATAIGFFLGRATRREPQEAPAHGPELLTARDRVRKLEADVDGLTAALAEARLQSASRAQARSEQAGEAAALDSRLRASESQIVTLERRLASARDQITHLLEERDQWEAEAGQGTPAKWERPSADVAALERDLVEARRRVAQLEASGAGSAGGDASQGDAALAEAQSRLAEMRSLLDGSQARMAELQAERDGLEAELLRAAEVAAAVAGGSVAEVEGPGAAEIETIRMELARREVELAKLERVLSDARRLEEELAVRDDRIGRLEAELERHGAALAAGTPGDAAAIGVSSGGGSFSDTRFEMKPTTE
jgi:chromosome segregation ATPase